MKLNGKAEYGIKQRSSCCYEVLWYSRNSHGLPGISNNSVLPQIISLLFHRFYWHQVGFIESYCWNSHSFLSLSPTHHDLLQVAVCWTLKSLVSEFMRFFGCLLMNDSCWLIGWDTKQYILSLCPSITNSKSPWICMSQQRFSVNNHDSWVPCLGYDYFNLLSGVHILQNTTHVVLVMVDNFIGVLSIVLLQASNTHALGK